MHELLAPLYYAVQYDSVLCSEDEDPTAFQEICSRTWVAADAWALFNVVMNGVSRWYEWRESPDRSLHLSSHVQLDVVSGQTQLRPYVAPIVKTCNDIQTSLLRAVDLPLWNHMQKQGIEPQIYGMYVRHLWARSLAHGAHAVDGSDYCSPANSTCRVL